MALRSKIRMKAVLDIIDNIKHVKKKKIEKGTIVRDANTLLGLDADDTTVALQNLENEGIVNFQDDIANVDVKAKWELSKSLIDINCERASVEIIETNSTQTQTESFDPDISRLPFSCSRMDEVSDIHRSFAQLAALMVSTQEIIQKERDLNRILAEENFDIKSKLQREQGSAKPEKSSRCETLSNEDNSNNADSQKPIITYEDIHSKTSAQITEQRKKPKHMNNKKIKKSGRKEPKKDGSNEESPSPKQEETAKTNCTMEATNKVNENESNNKNNNNMNNTPRRTSQEDRSSSQTQNKTRTTIICGDSMVKNIKSWKLKRSCNRGERIFVNSFLGANVHEMRTYCKTSIEKKPDCLIIHCGTNELKTNKSDVEISTEIISLAKSIETQGIQPIVSGLIARGDNYEEKRARTNLILQDMCKEENLLFVEHENIKANEHLNRSRLHLNKFGDSMLAVSLLEASRS